MSKLKELLEKAFRITTPLNGFKYAFEGIVHAIRTQRHMQFHFTMMVFMLILALLFHLSRDEMLILLFTVSLVLIAEMFNTAMEAIVDLVTQDYHPLAKFAKDIAAGAVLIASINAAAVGCMLFLGGGRVAIFTREAGGFESPTVPIVVVTGMVLLLALVIIWKVSGKKGKLIKGGVVSGHSAVGFFLACTIMYMTKKETAVGIMAFMLAILVAQSRVEGHIHTVWEVIWGGVFAIIVSVIVYSVFAPVF